MKRKISLFLTIAIVMSVITVGLFSITASAANTTASGTCGANLTWTLDDEGTLTISGTGAMNNYSSPLFSTSSLVPWYSLNSSITKVVIAQGITNIGDYAFCKCSKLTSITIPDSVTNIGDRAFWNCNITSITIPDSVTNIGEEAFGSCIDLESISVAADNNYYTSLDSNLYRIRRF